MVDVASGNNSRNGEFVIRARDGSARSGEFHTLHGAFETPAFMPVGTQGTVKGVNPDELRKLGSQIILSNTYHLHVRPGDELIKERGGLHRFMGWTGPILTDSGGFQIFSLSGLRKVSDDGVTFQSHVDGAKLFFSPEKVIQIQENLGVDIMMVLDECLPYQTPLEETRTSLERTLSWAKRSRAARRGQGLMFGIVQGGFFQELRKEASERLIEIGFDGYAIGGVSVGEPSELLYEFGGLTARFLPEDKIRYLMGVGKPTDILQAIGDGVDLFDCVIPTRGARFGRLFTSIGPINIRNSKYRNQDIPVEEVCDCYACRNFSRAYLAHLVHVQEILGVQLATIHNLRFYQRLMSDAREAIRSGRFAHFRQGFLEKYHSQGSPEIDVEEDANADENG